MNKLTDESPMSWGKHKGKQMADVPAGYLIWLWDNNNRDPQVKAYIQENLDVLRKQKEEEDDKKEDFNSFMGYGISPADIDHI